MSESVTTSTPREHRQRPVNLCRDNLPAHPRRGLGGHPVAQPHRHIAQAVAHQHGELRGLARHRITADELPLQLAALEARLHRLLLLEDGAPVLRPSGRLDLAAASGAVGALSLVEAAPGLRVTLDDSNEKLGKKIRGAAMEKVPWTIVIGGKEAEGGDFKVKVFGQEADIIITQANLITEAVAGGALPR